MMKKNLIYFCLTGLESVISQSEVTPPSFVCYYDALVVCI